MLKPKVFVGASSEAVQVDRRVRAILEGLGAEVLGWREVFHPGDFLLDTILNVGASVDASVLIAAPDDLCIIRSEDRLTPRDNVILELGIFLSCLGKQRTGIVHVKNGDGIATLPTDLDGVTKIIYDVTTPHANEERLSRWLDRVKVEIGARSDAFVAVHSLKDILHSMPISWIEKIEQYIISPVRHSLMLAERGEIELSIGQYYTALFNEGSWWVSG